MRQAGTSRHPVTPSPVRDLLPQCGGRWLQGEHEDKAAECEPPLQKGGARGPPQPSRSECVREHGLLLTRCGFCERVDAEPLTTTTPDSCCNSCLLGARGQRGLTLSVARARASATKRLWSLVSSRKPSSPSYLELNPSSYQGGLKHGGSGGHSDGQQQFWQGLRGSSACKEPGL